MDKMIIRVYEWCTYVLDWVLDWITFICVDKKSKDTSSNALYDMVVYNMISGAMNSIGLGHIICHNNRIGHIRWCTNKIIFWVRKGVFINGLAIMVVDYFYHGN